MKIRHFTSLGRAVSIIETGEFHASVKFPGLGDTGLNCYADGRSYVGNHHHASGVILTFYWSGQETSDTNKMLEPNWLCHWGSWRSVITKGTDQDLIATDISDSSRECWEAIASEPVWYEFPKSTVLAKSADRLAQTIGSSLKEGVPIRVI